MGHSITAIILKGKFNQQIAEKYDLIATQLDFNLNMFFIDHYFTACWQKKLNLQGYLETNCKEVILFPSEMVIYDLMKKISKTEQPEFAIILTDYFGGIGNQYANIYKGKEHINLKINTISQALKYFGVKKGNHHDEFDAIGLGKYRVNPDFLEKYQDLADELGV
jgi:hypothetical protein